MHLKTTLFALLLAAIALFSGCEGTSVGSGNLYVEYRGEGKELYMIKYLSPGENSGNGANAMGKLLRMQTVSGKEFYVFQAPKKEMDVYLEWYNTEQAYGTYVNDRVRVNLKANDWVKLMIRDAGDYHCIDGSGTVY